MSQECGFFNAELEGSEYDRVYNAEQFAAYFASFIGNGVFGDSMNELVVLENETPNMSINVSSGQAWVNGWWYRNTENYNLSVDVADGVLSRIDIVVVRWGNIERDMWLQVIKGIPSANPVAPDIVRSADYYDLKLCEISIPAGAVNIRQTQITDTRPINAVCGFVTGVVDQIDTTALYLQFNQQFGDWFNAVKEQFEGDVPEILQSQIDDLFGIISNRIERSQTSEHAYSNKDYFIYDNKLCKATKSIAEGDTISPGTTANDNCKYTTITEELPLGGGAVVIEELADILQTVTFDGEAAGAKAVKELNTTLLQEIGKVLDAKNISSTYTFYHLINETGAVFFSNWEDSTNFPEVYGSGILIPSADANIKFLIYITNSNVIWFNERYGNTMRGWRLSSHFYGDVFDRQLGGIDGGNRFLKLPTNDLNNIAYNSVYNVPQSEGVLNMPADIWGFLVTKAHCNGGGWARQDYYCMFNGDVWSRIRSNNSWGAWSLTSPNSISVSGTTLSITL